MIQHIIITIILAACILYVANSLYKTWHQTKTCKDYKCAGCPFYEKCEKNKTAKAKEKQR